MTHLDKSNIVKNGAKVESKFQKFMKDNGLEYKLPYEESDLKKAYIQGSLDVKEKLLKELFEKLEQNMVFYPVGGSSVVPALTMTELNKLKKQLIPEKEEKL